MKTINNFILERLKLNDESKISKQYKLLFIPYGANYDLLNNTYDKYKGDGKIINVLFLDIVAYIMDKDFFESKILKHYTDYSSYNDNEYESLDTIVKIPIDLDEKDLIDKYDKKYKYDYEEEIINLIRKDFEIYKINK